MLIPIIGQDDSISNMSNKIEAVHVQAITDNREQCWQRKLPTNLSTVAFSSCTISDQHGNGSNKGGGGGQHCLISLASVQLLLSLLQVKYWEGAGVLGRPENNRT